jgi:cysteinyl-tRNA synthetase
MSTKGITREEYCIAVPMLFSIYEGTSEYKKNKQFRDKILEQKKVNDEIVAGYTAEFKKQKEELEKAKEKVVQSLEDLTEKLKDQLMLEPNNEDIKKVIREIIAVEKKNNVYDEEYWEDILHLL